MKTINLGDIAHKLKGVYVRLDLEFLRKLFVDASKSNTPHLEKEFVELLGCKFSKNVPTSVYRWLYGQRNISIEKLMLVVNMSFFKWTDVERHIIFMKTKAKGGQIHPNFPIRLEEELGSILGHILGDGAIDSRLQAIFFSNSNPELLNEFASAMYTVFGIKPRIWQKKESNFDGGTKWDRRLNFIEEKGKGRNVGLFYPKICSLLLKAVFGNFADGKHKSITPEMSQQDIEFKTAFIRAFFDDEGSVIGRQIRVFQDREEILLQIKNMLKDLNIEASDIKHYVFRNRKRYHFNITGHYNYLRFLHTIGFTSSYKRERLEKLTANITKRRSFRLRVNEAKTNITEILEAGGGLPTSQIILQLKTRFKDLKWDRSTVLSHLSDLEKGGTVHKEKVKNTFIWELNSHFMECPPNCSLSPERTFPV